MKSPLVSVVITAYRSGNLLEKAIESVLKQTFRDFEIILVDNNASPETHNIVRAYTDKYPDRIRTIHEPQQGACSARNTGIRESKGKYIALLDDDDMMMPGRLEKQLQASFDHPDASMITCGADFIDHATGTILFPNVMGAHGKWKILEQHLRKALKQDFPSRNTDSFLFAYPSTMFFQRQKAIEAGLFDVRLNPNYGEDHVFCVQMFACGDFINIPEPLAIYRFNAPSSTATRHSPQKLRFLYLQGHKAFFVLWETLGKNNPETLSSFRKIAAFHLQIAGRHFLRYSHGTKIARKLLFRAWKFSPFNRELIKDVIKSRAPQKLLPRLFWFKKQNKDLLPPGIDQCFSESLFSIPPAWMK